jgi:hypothetical protein
MFHTVCTGGFVTVWLMRNSPRVGIYFAAKAPGASSFSPRNRLARRL